MYGGKFGFQNRLGQPYSWKEIYRFSLFYFVFGGNFQVQAPGGAYIWRGDLTEGFLRYEFGRLIFGGVYFRNFTVFDFGPEKLTGLSRNRPLALHQWSYIVRWKSCNVCIRHERKNTQTNFVVRALCTRPGGNGSRSHKVARMTGARLKNKAHFPALPLHVLPAQHNLANQSVMDRVTSCVKMFCDRETWQALLYALKVLAKMLAQCTPCFADVDGIATGTGDAKDQARRLARKRLLDNKRALRATDFGVAGNVLAGGTASV